MQDARKMKTLNNNNNNRKTPLLNNTHLATTTAAATIFTLAIIFTSTATLVSASTTGNNTTATTTSVGGEEQEALSSTTTPTNNVSNAVLGRLFSYDEGEDVESNVNPVNETYIVISYSGNRIILPPNGTSVINATETGNVTINIQPNGLSSNKANPPLPTKGLQQHKNQKMPTTTFYFTTE